MSENPIRLTLLFEKYADGSIGAGELEEFWQLLRELDEGDNLPEAVKAWWERHEGPYDLSRGADPEAMLERIKTRARAQEAETDYLRMHQKAGRKQMHFRVRWAAAAVLLVLLSGGIYLILMKAGSDKTQFAKTQSISTDILPGVMGATLTLSDGSKVRLDSTGSQVLKSQGGAHVKTADGALVYSGQAAQLIYNTLSTAKGQQYSLHLPDGTLVILDAASTLRYPVSFTGKDRRVEINGQGWFEVAKDPKRPFYVTKGDKTVRVYGTHFNVEAYDDEEALKVTLVEGSVKVTNGEVASMLRPGQQAVLSTSTSGVQVVKDVDIEQAIAWKNGQFAFESTDLKDVMRQVERWYNIKVEYRGPVPTDQFTGGINRTATLQELLKILSISRVHFTLEGKVLTVSAK